MMSLHILLFIFTGGGVRGGNEGPRERHLGGSRPRNTQGDTWKVGIHVYGYTSRKISTSPKPSVYIIRTLLKT